MTFKIGSHVGMGAKDYYLGSVKEALSYEANALMLYTGAPQNSVRTPLEKLKIEEAKQLLKEHDIPLENVIIHAPYLINLANTVNPDTFENSKKMLGVEIERSKAFGAKYLVLHPGSHLKMGSEAGIQKIIEGLNEVLAEHQDMIVALETMAGKGAEVGWRFEEIAEIIAGCKYPEWLGVCFDTCHTHDAGYDLADFDNVLKEFDRVIGLDRLNVIHLNDSMNERGARKDRHANLGYGKIGFDTLYNIAHHPSLENVVKILETPYVNGTAPYKYEIASLRSGKWDEHLMEIKG